MCELRSHIVLHVVSKRSVRENRITPTFTLHCPHELFWIGILTVLHRFLPTHTVLKMFSIHVNRKSFWDEIHVLCVIFSPSYRRKVEIPHYQMPNMSRARVRGTVNNTTGDLYVSSDEEDMNYITGQRLSTRTGKLLDLILSRQQQEYYSVIIKL